MEGTYLSYGACLPYPRAPRHSHLTMEHPSPKIIRTPSRALLLCLFSFRNHHPMSIAVFIFTIASQSIAILKRFHPSVAGFFRLHQTERNST